MRRLNSRRSLLPTIAASMVALLSFGAGDQTNAEPILYTRPAAGGGTEVWQVNFDGSGNQRVSIDLPSPDRPVWSKDGARYLVTSPDPGSPQLSQNVYSVEAGSSQATKLSSYSDISGVNPQTQQLETFISTPLFKAYAGNNTSFATSNIFRTIVNTTSTTVPLLEKFQGPGAPPVQLNLGAVFDGLTGQGLGVDWSPQGDRLLTPVAQVVPPNGQTVVPIGVFSPEGSGTFLGPLTDPQATVFFGGQTWENDYQPVFSPDGDHVAYFRATTIFSNGVFAESQVDLRVIGRDGRGDRLLFDFNPGVWPNQVTWSPDGTWLVFDFGPQVFEGGLPTFGSDVSQSSLAFVDFTGTTSGTIATAGAAAFPAWRPVSISGSVPGDYNNDGLVNDADYGVWLSRFGDAVARFASADGNGDGVINAADYTVWRDARAANASVVPEPATTALAALLTLGAATRPRKA